MPAADVYGLTRDAKESERLNTQHVVWKTNIGVLLHPKIAASIPSDAHIGDVGTGTGIWINDLAKEQQGSQYTYEGLDMSSDQFPKNPPKDIGFSLLNLLDPVPQDKKGTFDVLHLRLLVLGLPTGQWKIACENLFQLLKPGGYLQWEEGDFRNIKVLQSEVGASASTRAMKEIFTAMVDDGVKHGQAYEDVKELASIVASAGFEDVNTDVVSSDRVSETRQDYSMISVRAISHVVEMYQKRDGGKGYWSSDEAAKVLEQAYKDVESGKAYYRAEFNVVTARKGSK